MNYCSHCGSPRLEIRIPDGDTLPRTVCAVCGTIHYSNPKIVVGCLPEWDRKVLLCKRAINPRHGLWTLPAGFFEKGGNPFGGALGAKPAEKEARGALSAIF